MTPKKVIHNGNGGDDGISETCAQLHTALMNADGTLDDLLKQYNATTDPSQKDHLMSRIADARNSADQLRAKYQQNCPGWVPPPQLRPRFI